MHVFAYQLLVTFKGYFALDDELWLILIAEKFSTRLEQLAILHNRKPPLQSYRSTNQTHPTELLT